MNDRKLVLSPEALDFAPGLLAIQESPPARLPRTVMYMVIVLCAILMLWSIFGKLDIVASAEGKLVPQSYVKIVQPADGGIIQDILVKEGQTVAAGQVLIRMDAKEARADETSLQTQLVMRSLQLRRVDAELAGSQLVKKADDPADLYTQVAAQYSERRRAYTDALGGAQEMLKKNQRDYDAGKEVLAKLREITPILKQQSDAYTDMGKDGYAPLVTVRDKQREYLEKLNDLRAQESTLASLAAAVDAAGRQVAQVTSKYRSDLQNEEVEAQGQYRKLQQDSIKQEHKTGLLELKAPQGGTIKDLATHTIGTVVTPGTVLLSLVPENEPLIAEVMVSNDDVGFVYPEQKVKLKLAAYPFQKYGMLDGEILTIGADANEAQNQQQDSGKDPSAKNKANAATTYKALLSLGSQALEAQGKKYKLVPGMQVTAEISEGRRTVMQYLLSPVQKALQESGRER
jgi:HlyD family secretion protein